MRDRRLVVVSNRQPYSHVYSPGGVRWLRHAGGLVVALDAVLQALGGLWVAHGSGDADRSAVDEKDHVACPPDRPRYTLRRVWLSREDHERYYAGFSNGALWPLCHIVYVRPRFDLADWERYKDVNRRFAEATLEELGDGQALVFLQDYHLALAAATLRERRPSLHTALFWHIPWPNPEVFRILPWRRELLEGMLANDLLGFHTRARSALDSVADVGARVDRDIAVERGGRRGYGTLIGVDTGDRRAVRSDRGTRRRARASRSTRADRREGGARGRPARLHEGDSRAPAGAGPVVRAPPRMDRQAVLRPDRRAEPRRAGRVPRGAAAHARAGR
jgi:trehalose-6-phosphate synthase